MSSRHHWSATAIVGAALAMIPAVTPAATIFESGTLGPTGIPRGEVPSANVSSTVFNGVRFYLEQPAVTTDVGGHFVGSPGTMDTLFGAIVQLDHGQDFPDSGDLSTPDVLGTTILAFPEPSSEVFGGLALSLDHGWYALVFGSGLFGAVGDGAMPLNNPDIGEQSYIGYQPGAGFGWGHLVNPVFRDYRFVVAGVVVPEPKAIGLASSVLVLVLFRLTRNRCFECSHSY